MPHPPAGPLSALGGHLVGAALATRPGCRGGETRRAPAAGGGEDFGVHNGPSVFGRRPFVVAGGTVGHAEGTVCDAWDSSRRGGQFATRGTVLDGAADAAAAGHGGRAVCGRRRAAAAVAGVVAGACQRRSSRGGGGSLRRRTSKAFDGFRLDAVKHKAAPLHYALAGGRDGREMVGGGECGAAVGTTAVGSPTAGSCTTRSSNFMYSPTCPDTCLGKCE